MPFDIGWTEIAMIVVVAIIFIGPKDLPRVLRAVGEWVGKAKNLTREFRRHVDEMIREAELDEVKRQIESVGNVDVGNYVQNTIDPKGELAEAFDFGGSEFTGVKSDGSPETAKPADGTAEAKAEGSSANEPAPAPEKDKA